MQYYIMFSMDEEKILGQIRSFKMEMMKKLSFGTVWFWLERLLEIQNT